MNVYKTDNIRNVVLLGHGGSGKTSMIEAMAYGTKITNRIGKVSDGNTISDYDKEEIKRGISIGTSVIPIEFMGVKINILDTPGSFDFVGEVEEAISVADAAVIVINCKSGIEVGTIKAWEICEKYHLPRLFYVSSLDDSNADYTKLLEDLKEKFGKKIAPFHYPMKENGTFVGYANVIRQKGRKYKDDGSYDECDLPADMTDVIASSRDMIMEAVAETSEDLMNKYFDGEEFTMDEIFSALRNSVSDGDIVPVQCGASVYDQGVRMVVESIDRYFPAPNQSRTTFKKGIRHKDNSEFKATCDSDGPLAAYVFKTIIDPFVGKFSLVKVCSGTLKADDTIYCEEADYSEKIPKLYIIRGKNTEETKELMAGDIGAISKLTYTKTTETLSRKEDPITLEKPEFSVPYTYRRYKSVNKGDEDKISQALAKLVAEDMTLKVVNDEENRQMLMYGIGEQQLEVVAAKLKERYKVDIELSKPKVAFRETIKKRSEVEGKHKKQSGGHGQYGHVKMVFEPSGDLEKPYVFEEKIFGGSVPKNYFPAVEKGIQESVLKGPLAGYPVVGVKATLIDGSYHPVDSSEMAFKTATMLAFKKGFMEAGPILLEPIGTMRVFVPEKYTGDVMGDLNKRRGRVLGMTPDDSGYTTVEAEIPLSELYGYSADLRSMTGGIGRYEYEFNRYEQAPSDVQQREIEARAQKEDN